MERIELRKHLSNEEAELLKGKYLDHTHYDQLVQTDCDAHDMHGNLLFKFRKGAMPMDKLLNGYNNFKNSIELTEGRGIASGSSHKRILKDGTVSNITVGNKVESGNVGYMDAGAMVKYCRKTAFAKRYFDEFTAGLEFVNEVDRLYKTLCPDQHKKQMAISRGTDINYRLGDTAFTTVTVNKNFRTAVHQDSGDYRDGFGNLIVYREGHYKGGYFVLPEYRVAIDLQNTDVLFVDVHKWHGNTEFTDCSPDWLRISFVLYYRENMIKCAKPQEELKKAKQEHNGYLKI